MPKSMISQGSSVKTATAIIVATARCRIMRAAPLSLQAPAANVHSKCAVQVFQLEGLKARSRLYVRERRSGSAHCKPITPFPLLDRENESRDRCLSRN
jgi:hypothetical protein